MQYDLVIASAPNHFEMVWRNKELYFKNLPIQRIIVIGSREGEKYFQDDDRITLMDEEKLYPGLGMLSIRYLVEKQGGHMTRSNWYFQQFLKMAYACHCKNEYYILWDADTVPVAGAFRPVAGVPSAHVQRQNLNRLVLVDREMEGDVLLVPSIVEISAFVDRRTEVPGVVDGDVTDVRHGISIFVLQIVFILLQKILPDGQPLVMHRGTSADSQQEQRRNGPHPNVHVPHSPVNSSFRQP